MFILPASRSISLKEKRGAQTSPPEDALSRYVKPGAIAAGGCRQYELSAG